jgi:hypothetical protein
MKSGGQRSFSRNILWGGKRKRRAVEARLFDGVGLVLGGFAGCDLVAG